MRSLLRISAMMTTAALVASCGPSTTLKTSWKDPSVTEPIHFNKVMALMIEKDGATRRRVEDMMVQRITANHPNVTAVPSYTLLGEEELKNKDQVKEIVQQAGVDGAVVVRVVGVDKQTTYVPGSYPTPYYSFYGYYDYAWPGAYDPGYIQTDTIVNLETNVYSVKDEKLIWSGVTETFNPSSAEDLMEQVGMCVGQAVRTDGVIQ